MKGADGEHGGSRTPSGFGHLSRPRRTTAVHKSGEVPSLAEAIAEAKSDASKVSNQVIIGSAKDQRVTAEQMGIGGGQGRSGEDVRSSSHISWIGGLIIAGILIGVLWYLGRTQG